ncbi:hypothetical protein GA0070607_2158 [Micromonospora coriariae]|uniref:Uncharacterized protein n=1 Tax=Micromonospora coriariae TaxID=285665 RepID=A0A1C4VHZ5_9ACTN|nr:hypothetical protein GA0070607_2158 [Micromonospora coriariae]
MCWDGFVKHVLGLDTPAAGRPLGYWDRPNSA